MQKAHNGIPVLLLSQGNELTERLRHEGGGRKGRKGNPARGNLYDDAPLLPARTFLMFSHCSPRFCPVISFFHSTTRELRGCNRDPDTASLALSALPNFAPESKQKYSISRRSCVRLQYLRSPTTFLEERRNVLHLRRACLIVERGRLTPLTWVNAFPNHGGGGVDACFSRKDAQRSAS